MKIIKVKIKEQYGRSVYYPDCPDSKTFAAIAATKTLSVDVLSCIGALGYDIRASWAKMPQAPEFSLLKMKS